MAGNKPGDNGSNQDPWTGKNKASSPPDLEEAIRKLYKKLVATTGKKKPNRPSDFFGNNIKIKLTGILCALLALWVISGIFVVSANERAVVLHFGRYRETLAAGVHWLPRFVDTATIISTDKNFIYSYEGEALTNDAQNIVLVSAVVQYRIAEPTAYLFNVDNTRIFLHRVIANVVQQTVGQSTIDAIFTSGREQINQQLKNVLLQKLQAYKTGVTITDAVIQKVSVPEKIKPTFAEVTKAAQEAQNAREQAQAYSQQITPVAETQAKSVIADAQTYKQQAVLRAESEVAPFLALLPAYQQSPALLRERLYMSTMETVLSNTRKIFVDASARDVIYLPLNKLYAAASAKAPETAMGETVAPAVVESTVAAKPAVAGVRTESYGKGGYE